MSPHRKPLLEKLGTALVGAHMAPRSQATPAWHLYHHAPGKVSCQLRISSERQQRGTQAAGGEGVNPGAWEEGGGAGPPGSATSPRG